MKPPPEVLLDVVLTVLGVIIVGLLTIILTLGILNTVRP